MNKILNNISKAGVVATTLGLLLMAIPVGAESPTGCSADNSIVNISTDKIVAEIGETITFSVSAGNPASVDGCDIENRTVTLTLPNGAVTAFGPSNYPNPTATAVIGSVPYIASGADLVGGLWTANVSWNGTLKGISDLPSNGQKNVSVNEVTDLTVVKTAVPASEISYEWTIDKSVVPATWNLFNGDSGISEYTIALDKSTGTESHSVSGTITINNPNNVETANITGVTDSITGLGAVTVVCPVSFPHVLAAGASLVCTYSTALPDETTRTNTATVTTTGNVDGASDDETIDFTNVVPTIVNGSVSIDDTFNAGDNAGPITDDTSYTYTRQFVCGVGQGEYQGTGNVVENTATIVETEQSDDASVTVNCYNLTVQKTANTTFDRTYQWNVEKTANDTEIELAEGEAYQISYTVTASVTGSVDSNWAVSGSITITNPAPMSATVNSVGDSISGVGAVTVTCPGNPGPYVIAGNGGTLVCTYTSVLPNGDNRTNTATATQQNYDYDKALVATPDGTTNYTGNANVTFGAPANVIDEEVTVTDSFAGVLGIATVAESPKAFNYNRNVLFEGEGACGDHDVDNTATITTNDTQTVNTDDVTVLVHINCFEGCTLTQGYWKTHSTYGPAAHPDDNWASVGGPDAIFYLSGMTWLQVFKTAPKGNAYYNLAHQFMAAVLNINNDASTTPAVDGAITSATNFFNTYTPASFNALGKNSQVRKDVLTWAGILGSYNEGLTGPGHCDEQVPQI